MGRKELKIKTTPMKITLTDIEVVCLDHTRKAGSFRSNSETIGEVLRLAQALRDSVDVRVTLHALGPRFGIHQFDQFEPGTVWVVYKTVENEGADFYAICQDEKTAEKARTKLAAKLGEVETHFDIAEIARDAVHPYGLFCQDDSVGVE